MARKSTVVVQLPLLTQKEVIDWHRSGKYTLDKMTEMLHARGYLISRSALDRFVKQHQGTEGVLFAWAKANPEESAVLARMLEANPNGGFTLYVRSRKARNANPQRDAS